MPKFQIGDIVAYAQNLQLMRIIDIPERENSKKIIYELVDGNGQAGYFMFESVLIRIEEAIYILNSLEKKE